MSDTENQPRRRRSMLSDDVLQPIPARPPAASTPQLPPSTASDPAPASRADARARGRARDEAEARGRKDTRSAAYAWATATQRALARADELDAQLTAAIERGTEIAVLAEYAREACERHGLAVDRLPASIRIRLGIGSS